MKRNYPKRGDLYRHKVWLEGDHKTPLTVKVFQVRNGLVWWGHATARRSSTVTDVERFLRETERLSI